MRNTNVWLKTKIIWQNNYPSTKNKFLKMTGSISLERIFFFCKTAPCVTSPRTSLERKNTESKGRTRVVSFLYSLSPLIILYCTHQVTLCILTTHPLFTHTPIEIEENKQQQQKSFFKNEIILLE